MDTIICVHCSTTGHIYAALKTFIVSWFEGKVHNIIYYYECKECGRLYSVSVPTREER